MLVRTLAMGLVVVGTGAGAKVPPPPAVVTGPPVSCVLIQNIRNTNVVDDKTIDFMMNGRQVYRNNLPNSCPQLAFNNAFGYQTSNGQLCSVDIITVLVQGGGIARGASCGLGKFTPIAPPPRK
ncbi:hypothetical protein [Polymorphobacter fuscus]